MERFKKLVDDFGLPNFIIAGFLVILFFLTGPAGIRIDKSFTDIMFRLLLHRLMRPMGVR